jgi:putative endonuclease
MSAAVRLRSHFVVYILRCADGTLYTGHTKDLEARLKLHNSGKGAKYLRGRTPVMVVYTKTYRDHARAAGEEYRIKTLTRLGKEALIKSAGST